MSADLSSRELWDSSGLRLSCPTVNWMVLLVLGHVRHPMAPTRYLPVGEGDLLQVDGGLHGLEQGVPLFRVKLEAPLAGVAPATRLK